MERDLVSGPKHNPIDTRAETQLCYRLKRVPFSLVCDQGSMPLFSPMEAWGRPALDPGQSLKRDLCLEVEIGPPQ
jgi:hypothetical protein